MAWRHIAIGTGGLAAALMALPLAAQSAPRPPADAVEILGPGSVSKEGRYEFCSTMSRDRRTITIGIEHGPWQSLEAYHWEDGSWTGPEQVYGSPEYTAQDPYLSEDEERLYFITRAEGSADIGYLQRGDDGAWTDPILLGPPVNTSANDYFVSITKDGDIYWSSDRSGGGNYDIYRANPARDPDAGAERLPEQVNSQRYEGDPFVDPDGRYLIFASNRREGRGRGDLYLVISDGEGGWSEPVAFDERVNTPGHELCPLVTLDGSALLFTSNQDIRWISASIIDDMIAEYEEGASEG